MRWVLLLVLAITVSASGPREVSFEEWSAQPIVVAQVKKVPVVDDAEMAEIRRTGVEDGKRLKRLKRFISRLGKKKEKGMCDLKIPSLHDPQIHCPCLSSCPGRASEESQEAVNEAVRYCLWMSLNNEKWWVLNSWEIKEVMKQHCPSARCIETSFERNPTHTIEVLTDNWENTKSDTIIECYPGLYNLRTIKTDDN